MIKTYLLQAPTYLEQIFKPLASIVKKFTSKRKITVLWLTNGKYRKKKSIYLITSKSQIDFPSLVYSLIKCAQQQKYHRFLDLIRTISTNCSSHFTVHCKFLITFVTPLLTVSKMVTNFIEFFNHIIL